ncbi:DUF6193 family natural product biosynthesis protein [Streptomyces niveus]|uniref:DUF6193 family natural product biosynthesis protein n=1 Tax=Streptomyces niveus TaxID=193462 RepID=UPI00342A0597
MGAGQEPAGAAGGAVVSALQQARRSLRTGTGRGGGAAVAHNAGAGGRGTGFTGFGELVEAAHAESRLRQLYVFSSQWTLGFSSCTGYPFRNEVAIIPSHSGSPFRVKRHPLSDDVLGESTTAEEAVAMAVRHLLTDLGPAVAGTAEQDG